jgi:hypothetical protein
LNEAIIDTLVSIIRIIKNYLIVGGSNEFRVYDIKDNYNMIVKRTDTQFLKDLIIINQNKYMYQTK